MSALPNAHCHRAATVEDLQDMIGYCSARTHRLDYIRALFYLGVCDY